MSRFLLSRIPFQYLPFSVTEYINKINFGTVHYPFENTVDSYEFYTYNFPRSDNEKLLNLMLDSVSKGDIVFDAGAFYGSYTLALARAGATVYSFEPNPCAYWRLKQNIELNDFNKVTIYNNGLSDQQGEFPFFISSKMSQSSFNKYNAKIDEYEIIDNLSVEVTTIDELIYTQGLEPPNAIKVDVEGLGIEVIRGAKKCLEHYTPTVFFEPHEVADGYWRLDELYKVLDSIEYNATEYHADGYARPIVCEPK